MIDVTKTIIEIPVITLDNGVTFGMVGRSGQFVTETRAAVRKELLWRPKCLEPVHEKGAGHRLSSLIRNDVVCSLAHLYIAVEEKA